MIWGVTCADGKKREELSDYEVYQEWLQNRRDQYKDRIKKTSWHTEVSTVVLFFNLDTLHGLLAFDHSSVINSS